MLVELKNGDTYNGRLDNCDSWMNIKLKDVIFTSRVRFDTGVATRCGCSQACHWFAITANRHELGDSPKPSGIMVSKIRGLLFPKQSNGRLLYAIFRGHPSLPAGFVGLVKSPVAVKHTTAGAKAGPDGFTNNMHPEHRRDHDS